jgi:hypothetical protein
MAAVTQGMFLLPHVTWYRQNTPRRFIVNAVNFFSSNFRPIGSFSAMISEMSIFYALAPRKYPKEALRQEPSNKSPAYKWLTFLS